MSLKTVVFKVGPPGGVRGASEKLRKDKQKTNNNKKNHIIIIIIFFCVDLVVYYLVVIYCKKNCSLIIFLR